MIDRRRPHDLPADALGHAKTNALRALGERASLYGALGGSPMVCATLTGFEGDFRDDFASVL